MTLDSRPLVSVITPVYNGERYLSECIESVLAQTYTQWEYVVVDNRSKDRTPEIARRYAERDPRIRVHTNSEFVDAIPNHNIACRQISPASRYCKVLQADDWLFPNCLQEMTALAEANPSVGIVGSYTLFDSRVSCDGLPYPSTVVRGAAACRRNLLQEVHLFLSPTVLMVRSDLVRSRDRYYNEAHLHADVEACYETLRNSDFGFVHQVLSFVRRHEDSLTSSVAGRLNMILLANLSMLVQFGPVYLPGEEHAAQLRRQLRKYYRALARTVAASTEAERVIEYHAGGFRELGLTFHRARLAREVAWLKLKAWVRGGAGATGARPPGRGA